MIKLDIRSDLKKLTRQLDDFTKKQMPFAVASALTAMAKAVQVEETKAIAQTFDKPTPFTLRSVGIKAARKTDPTALVFVRDVAASYLQPFEDGGTHYLGNKRGLLVPKDAKVNQYGNLSRGALDRYKARSDVFIGKVRLKNGEVINGVWQRPPVGARRGGGKGSKGNTQGKVGSMRTGLKLLIRFEDPLPVKEHLGYQDRARKILKGLAAVELQKAIAKAIATAK